MAAKKKAKPKSEIVTIACAVCGQDASGPNEDSVKAVMARHAEKTGHEARR